MLVVAIVSNLSKSLSVEILDRMKTFRLTHHSKQAFSWANMNLI
jgi:hypothetical protein